MSKEPTDPRTVENSWYYLLDGETRGPLSGTELRRLFRSGGLVPDTLVWRQGMRDWLPARALGVGTAPPPPTPTTATPVRAPAPPPAASPPGVAPRTRAVESSPGKRRSNKRRVQLVAVCVLAAMVLLLSGVGIGLMLRSPTEPTHDDLRASAQQDDQPLRNGRDSSAMRRTRGQESTPDQAVVPPAPPAPHAKMADSASGRSVSLPVPEDRVEATREVTGPPGLSTDPNPPMADSSTKVPADAATVLYQVIDMHRRPSFGLSGISMAQDIRYQILSRLELAPRAADGSRKVVQVVEQSRLDAVDGMSRGTYETALRDLIGQQYAFTLNDRGEIVEFSGFKKTTTAAPVTRPGEEGFMVVTVIDEDGWKELAQLTFLQPDRSIASGQPWKRPMTHDFSPLGCWQGTTTFTQHGPEGTGMRYDYVHEMSFVQSEKTGGVLPFDITGANFRALKATGWFVFDAEKRHVTSVHEDYHVEGTIGAGLSGGAAELQLQEVQETTIQISGQNPWAQVR